MKAFKLMVQLRLSLVGLVFSALGFSHGWVSTSPQITELLFQLDLGEKLVGTTEQSFYPPAAKTLRRVGQLFNPNLEAILACDPDLVIWDSSSFNPAIESRLLKLGVLSVKISLDSVEDVFKAADFFTRQYRSGKKSDDLIRAEIEWESVQKNKKVFSFIAFAWGEPPITFGESTFLFSLLEGLGGTGVLPHKWSKNYLKVSEEWVMNRKPTHVFYLKHDESSVALMKKQCAKWWMNQPIPCTGVSAEKFARASLTPFMALSELKLALESPSYE